MSMLQWVCIGELKGDKTAGNILADPSCGLCKDANGKLGIKKLQ
jgi:hypothetical protein